MKREESNKTIDSLVEKDMVLNKGGIVLKNGEIVFIKNEQKKIYVFSFSVFVCVCKWEVLKIWEQWFGKWTLYG